MSAASAIGRDAHRKRSRRFLTNEPLWQAPVASVTQRGILPPEWGNMILLLLFHPDLLLPPRLKYRQTCCHRRYIQISTISLSGEQHREVSAEVI